MLATITTKRKLLDVLANLHKGRFASIVVETDANISNKQKKELQDKNGKCRIRKRSYMTIRTGIDYQKTVNARLNKEGKNTVNTEKLPWGTWLIPGVVITHKNKNYLRVYPSKAITEYYYDGKLIPKDSISDILHEKNESNRYNLDNNVVVRTVALDNIIEINADGKNITL